VKVRKSGSLQIIEWISSILIANSSKAEENSTADSDRVARKTRTPLRKILRANKNAFSIRANVMMDIPIAGAIERTIGRNGGNSLSRVYFPLPASMETPWPCEKFFAAVMYALESGDTPGLYAVAYKTRQKPKREDSRRQIRVRFSMTTVCYSTVLFLRVLLLVNQHLRKFSGNCFVLAG
jgi:hypothetical protein